MTSKGFVNHLQTSPKTGEAELYYLRLPKDIKNYRVMLMDATVATGASAMMAIRVLLDHDVPEENINLVHVFCKCLFVSKLIFFQTALVKKSITV